MLEEKLVLREERLDLGGRFILSRRSDNAIEDECKDLPVYEYLANDLRADGRIVRTVSVTFPSPKPHVKYARLRDRLSYVGRTWNDRNSSRKYAYALAIKQAEIIAKLSGLELVDEVDINGSKSDGRDKC